MTHTIVVPGTVYYDALDPNATGMERELGLPRPAFRKQGRGEQAIYLDVDPVPARDLVNYLYERAELMLSQKGLEDKGVFYAMRTTAAKLDAQLATDAVPSSTA